MDSCQVAEIETEIDRDREIDWERCFGGQGREWNGRVQATDTTATLYTAIPISIINFDRT